MSTEQTSSTDGATLVERLAAIAATLESFPKTERVGGKSGYAFAGVDAMSNAIRPAMAEAGIVMLPAELEIVESGRYVRERADRETGAAFQTIEWRAVVKVRWAVTDGRETLYVESMGEALDTSDKAANKAQTASRKYAMIGLFNISTGDEPDSDDGRPGEHVNEPVPGRAPARRGPRPAAPPPMPSEDEQILFRDKLREVYALSDDDWLTTFSEWLAAQTASQTSDVRAWLEARVADDEIDSWPPVLDRAATERVYGLLARKAEDLLAEAAGSGVSGGGES